MELKKGNNKNTFENSSYFFPFFSLFENWTNWFQIILIWKCFTLFHFFLKNGNKFDKFGNNSSNLEKGSFFQKKEIKKRTTTNKMEQTIKKKNSILFFQNCNNFERLPL